MLPVLPQPGLVQIKSFYDPDPTTAEHPMNLLWFVQRSPGPLSIGALTTIGNAFDPLWASLYQQYGANGQHYIGSLTTDFSSTSGLQYDSRGAWTPSPGTSGNSVPPNVSLLISLHVAERYRGGHARIYLPYVGDNVVSTANPSVVISSFVAAVGTKFAAIEPGMNAIAVNGGLSQRVYRFRTNAAKAKLDQISAYTVQGNFASQRRRLRKAPHH